MKKNFICELLVPFEFKAMLRGQQDMLWSQILTNARSVAMELKEMSSLKREDLDLDIYVKPEAPAEIDLGHLDAGHLTFLAIPKPATPPLVVTESTSAGENRSSASAKSGTPARDFASETSRDKPGAAQICPRCALQI